MEKTLVVKSLDELDTAAGELLNFCNNGKIFAFYGEMGAGKTTFIKAICRQLGVKDDVNSPTFAIVNEYEAGRPVYHMDFYRIKDVQEAVDIGLADYFDQEALFFIEWPSRIAPLLPDETIRVDITADAQQHRTITITTNTYT